MKNSKCISILDKHHADCKGALEQVICMLTKMCINLELEITRERKGKS